MTRVFFLFMALLVLQSADSRCLAAEPSTENKNGTLESSQQGSEQEKQPPTTWPYPFRPSTEINADAQVSFPSDI